MNILRDFPLWWKPENFAITFEARTPVNKIIDNENIDYTFTCHKTLAKGENGSVCLYGQLNECTAITQWGERRYVLITIDNQGARMVSLEGPRIDLERNKSQSTMSRFTLNI